MYYAHPGMSDTRRRSSTQLPQSRPVLNPLGAGQQFSRNLLRHWPSWAVPTVAAICLCTVVLGLIALLQDFRSLASIHAKATTAGDVIEQNTRAELVDSTRQKCMRVMQRQKDLLSDVFAEALDGVRDAVIIGVPHHENKGDSAILVAELQLLTSLGVTVHYMCSDNNCDHARIASVLQAAGSEHFAILFQGGGNLGDLYPWEEEVRLRVMKDMKDVRMHMFPQSIKFRKEANIARTVEAIAGLTHPKNTLAFRDQQSYDFAVRHFERANMRIYLTPDIVFWMGFRPDLRRQLLQRDMSNRRDILFFRRDDEERTDWACATDGATEPVEALRRRLSTIARRQAGSEQLELSVDEGDWANTNLKDGERKGSILYQAWRRWRIGATWLDSADFIVMDRLHGHIVSLVLGIPHILIDNSIGKLGDYHSTWTEDCPLGHLVQDNGTNDMAQRIENRYLQWLDEGKISGNDF